jgi:hypothetical protein
VIVIMLEPIRIEVKKTHCSEIDINPLTLLDEVMTTHLAR